MQDRTANIITIYVIVANAWCFASGNMHRNKRMNIFSFFNLLFFCICVIIKGITSDISNAHDCRTRQNEYAEKFYGMFKIRARQGRCFSFSLNFIHFNKWILNFNIKLKIRIDVLTFVAANAKYCHFEC